ncbi:hypothetical protein [Lactiplantibacillus plantarum]|uniref:hypothetical protein n=1 Tax=Lactiplantibacillus plantarum TaxID=1590 RepID=UPI002B21B56B|nr:hypothetical protein [Lactiplantibacillus plantarum]
METGQNRLFDWLRTHGYLIAMGKRYNHRPNERWSWDHGVRETVITLTMVQDTLTPLITARTAVFC